MEQPKVLFGLSCSIRASVGPKVPSVILVFQFKRKKVHRTRGHLIETFSPCILCAPTSPRANTT